MKNLKRNKKGITLVALVVTIILLLILAGISIATLTQSGLFEKARLAEQESKNAQEREDAILSDYENKIGEYVDSFRDVSGSINITKNGNYDVSKYATANVNVSTGFVGFFNSVFSSSTTDQREIAISDYNSSYATAQNNTLTITIPGSYTAYITVGHSPYFNGYTGFGTLYINDTAVRQVKHSYLEAEGTVPYNFTVKEGEQANIKYLISCGGSVAQSYEFGSVIILKN